MAETPDPYDATVSGSGAGGHVRVKSTLGAGFSVGVLEVIAGDDIGDLSNFWGPDSFTVDPGRCLLRFAARVKLVLPASGAGNARIGLLSGGWEIVFFRNTGIDNHLRILVTDGVNSVAADTGLAITATTDWIDLVFAVADADHLVFWVSGVNSVLSPFVLQPSLATPAPFALSSSAGLWKPIVEVACLEDPSNPSIEVDTITVWTAQ